jgi:replicative DNA helicase
MTGGFHKQNLVVVAARPGLGKTSFCLNIASHAAMKHGKRVGIFSLEMSKPEIMKRMISSDSEVDSYRIQSGYLTRDDWARIGQAAERISEAPVHVDDSANLTMLQVRAKAQRLALEHGLDLLVVDYLQLVSGSGRRHENRTQEVTEISRGLKNLAKELDIPVIAVSQLNREVEKRSGGRRPQLSDLRESGAIEADADLVLFISSEETTDAPGGDSVADITIGKQRNGETERKRAGEVADGPRGVLRPCAAEGGDSALPADPGAVEAFARAVGGACRQGRHAPDLEVHDAGGAS